MHTYSFGVPGFFIQLIHVLIGGYLAYLGGIKKILSRQDRNILLLLGSLALIYHVHIQLLHFL